jgi:hypothetical protein
VQALERVLDIEDIPEFFGGKFIGPWDGDAVTPSARFAIHSADRSKVRVRFTDRPVPTALPADSLTTDPRRGMGGGTQSMWQRTDEWVQRNQARMLGLESGPLSPTSWVQKQHQMARTSDDLSSPGTRDHGYARGREPHAATPLLEQVAMNETTFDSVIGGSAPHTVALTQLSPQPNFRRPGGELPLAVAAVGAGVGLLRRVGLLPAQGALSAVSSSLRLFPIARTVSYVWSFIRPSESCP